MYTDVYGIGATSVQVWRAKLRIYTYTFKPKINLLFVHLPMLDIGPAKGLNVDFLPDALYDVGIRFEVGSQLLLCFQV